MVSQSIKRIFRGVPIFNDVKEIANDPKDLFQQNQISSHLDIRVNRSACEEIAEGKKTLATSSRTSLELLNKQDPLMSFTKMFMGISLGLDEVLFKMESINYCTRTFVFPSSSIGAWHKRDRLWIVCKSLRNPTRWIIFPQGCRSSRKCKKVTKGTEETEQSERAVKIH